MIVLAGGDLVLPDRVMSGGSLSIDGDRIVGIEDGTVPIDANAEVRWVTGRTIVPGFIDVHVHGLEGCDVLDGPLGVAHVAARLPRFGVTAFCPTSVACGPDVLATFLSAVRDARSTSPGRSARVLPAHLESNFINPSWAGAQPAGCLRTYHPPRQALPSSAFTAGDILRAMEIERAAVAIVTLAPEIAGGLDLVRLLRGRGHIVSIGHTGATYEEACDAIGAGATHATHLFNRMTAVSHREPGAAGAILASPEVAAELICDGFHVHPAVVSLALAAKTAGRVMAITDGTAAAGLPVGARSTLGGRTIVVTPRSAELEDGTLAGSVITMDRAFRMLVRQVGVPLQVAARLCATTAADQLGLALQGRLAVGALADLAVLGPALEVTETWLGGELVSEHQPPDVRLHRP